MIGGCALNHGLEKVRVQKCGMSMHSGCAQFMTLTQNMHPTNNRDQDVLRFAKFQLDLGSGKNLPPDGSISIPQCQGMSQL